MDADREFYNIKIPKRWLTFSIGKVLLLLTVVSLPMSWVARRLPESSREAAAVAEIEALGGKVYYHTIPGTRLLSRLIGNDIFRHVVQVDLRRTQTADISFLSDLPHVLAIQLDWTDVDDIKPLRNCSELISLSLEGTAVSDISPLSELRHLGSLNLSGTPLIDLSPLPVSELHTLSLCNFKTINLAPLQKAEKLSDLNLYKAVGVDCSQLHDLTGLRRLNIRDCCVKSAQVYKLKSSLPYCKIDHSL